MAQMNVLIKTKIQNGYRDSCHEWGMIIMKGLPTRLFAGIQQSKVICKGLKLTCNTPSSRWATGCLAWPVLTCLLALQEFEETAESSESIRRFLGGWLNDSVKTAYGEIFWGTLQYDFNARIRISRYALCVAMFLKSITQHSRRLACLKSYVATISSRMKGTRSCQ